MLPLLWAQAPALDPSAVPLLALRRWYASLTLSSPEGVPSRNGLWAWLLGLLATLVVAAMFQGPFRAIKQLFDIAGHIRLAGEVSARLRRSGRLVAALLGATVVAWTVSQAFSYSKDQGRADLEVLLKTKSVREVAFEQATLAALTPLRDVCGLADNLLLLIGAAVMVFRLSADRWAGTEDFLRPARRTAPGSATLCWGSAWLYVIYRLASLVPGIGEDRLPLGGCFFVEAAIIPVLMALADGLLLAWVLRELRASEAETDSDRGFDVAGMIALVPAAALACVAALPARYVGTATWLALNDIPSLGRLAAVRTLVLGWGLVALQGMALMTVGLAGAVAWGRGDISGSLRGYARMLRKEGGRLVAVLVWSGLASGALAGLAYSIVLALPPQPWVLAAADSYAHYATLPIGLATMAALVELGRRAGLAESPTVAEPAEEAAALV